MPFQDKRICIRSCCVPDLIIVTLPDIPKDVSGHDAQEGEPGEPHEDRDQGAADGDNTGQPVTVVDLGEKGVVVKLIEKSGIPNLTIFDLYTCQI